MKYPITHLVLLFGLLVMFVGCSKQSAQVDLKVERELFQLNVMPASVTNLGQAKEKLTEQPEVSIEGWADLKFFESRQNEAVFMVREILEDSDHSGEDGHDPSSCPFCKRRMEAAPKAAVVFADKGNKALPYAVNDLFPVKHGDKVVVRGTGKLDKDLDLFKITASGIYFPPETSSDDAEKN